MPRIFRASEPLGLPRGSVRALIVLGLTAVLIQQVWVGAVINGAFLVIAAVAITLYFTERAAETRGVPVEESLPEPVVG